MRMCGRQSRNAGLQTLNANSIMITSLFCISERPQVYYNVMNKSNDKSSPESQLCEV